MRRVAFISTAILLLIVAIGTITGCGQPVREDGKMVAAVSIAPLADFAKQVAGGLARVELLTPPGANAHTYEPTPSQLETLSKASVLVLNGADLEFWADKTIRSVDNPKLIVVRTADGLKLLHSSESPEDIHGNPHVWLDPILAIHQVNAIRDAFVKADPAHRKQYTANAAGYTRKLKLLDSDIRARVGTFSSRKFIAFHPAWVYFAREYGLVQAAVIERSPGTEPSAAEIRDLVDEARRLKVKAIFAEPQLSPKAAEVIASEVGAKVLFLDPMGKPPEYSYIRTMRSNLDQMTEALK